MTLFRRKSSVSYVEIDESDNDGDSINNDNVTQTYCSDVSQSNTDDNSSSSAIMPRHLLQYGPLASYPLILRNAFGGKKIDTKSYKIVKDMFVKTQITTALVRRRLLYLFSIFDVLLTFYVWLLYEMLQNYGSISELIEIQIVNFQFHTSLFDLVVLSFIRCSLLTTLLNVTDKRHEYFYHFGSLLISFYLILKIGIYKGTSDHNVSCYVLLMTLSFVCIWIELFLFDVNILQHIRDFSEILAEVERQQSIYETTPDQVHITLPATPSARRISITGSANQVYYSPIETPTGSTGFDATASTSLNVLTAEDLSFVRKAKEVMLNSLEVIFTEGWTKEFKGDSDMIESKVVEGVKVFRMQALLNATAEQVMTVLYDEFESQCTWNSGVIETKLLKSLDAHTDVAYTVSIAKGPVKSRDFVLLRHRAAVGASLVIASISIESFLKPPNKMYIRGENGPSCLVMTPLHDDPQKCDLRWLVNTNLKGWLPKVLVDASFTSFMQIFISDLRSMLLRAPKSQSDILLLIKSMPNLPISELPTSIKDWETVKSIMDSLSKSQSVSDTLILTPETPPERQ